MINSLVVGYFTSHNRLHLSFLYRLREYLIISKLRLAGFFPPLFRLVGPLSVPVELWWRRQWLRIHMPEFLDTKQRREKLLSACPTLIREGKITNFRWTLNGGYQHFFVALFFSGDHLAIVRSTYLFRNFFTPCVWSINFTFRCSYKCCIAFRFKPSLANYFWLWSSVTCNMANRYQLNTNR